MGRSKPPLGPPTAEERARARAAAEAMRAVAEGRMKAGKRGVVHLDMARPRRGVWLVTWDNLPGLFFEAGRYSHQCLPGWTYTREEVCTEMIPDLEALAERGERPSQVTGGLFR